VSVASDRERERGAAGRALLRRRADAVPDALRAFDPLEAAALLAAPLPPAGLVATGAGASLEHARVLAALVADTAGIPARALPPSAFLGAPDPRARGAALVVFSQGLSPNARAALAHAGAYASATLVTSANPAAGGAEGDEAGGGAARAEALAAFARAGGRTLRLPVDRESGLLVRVVGPLLASAAAIELARGAARAAGAEPPWPTPAGDALAAAVAAAAQRGRALRAERAGDPLSGALAFLAGPEAARLAGPLARKLLEGLLVPLPPVWDLLDFAHGGFQQLFAGDATLLALLGPDPAHDEALLARAAAMLDPARHAVLALRARLAGPHGALEHEAVANELMLAAIDARGLDPARWPGRGGDAPLYALEAPPAVSAPSPERALARLAWPELEALLAGGATTAVIALGSTEQHGPHLPFATDTLVADALAERFCARVPEAVRLPAVPFGCASEHLAFPGTLSLEPATLAAVLADLAASVAGHGFRHLVVFSAHGGNADVLRGAAPALARASGGAHVHVLGTGGAPGAAVLAAAARAGVSAAAAGQHAGEVETSMLLALAPGDVRTARAEPGPDDLPADPRALFYPDLRRHAPNGVVGDPRGADAARAAAYLDAWASALVAEYEAAKKRAYTNGTKSA
jgi:creatinine amidohydrolase